MPAAPRDRASARVRGRRCRRRWPWARLRHQFVTARFGDQDGRAGSVPLDLLTQPVDVRLERVGGDAGVIAPDLLQQGLARNRTLAGAIEISQDRSLLLREPHLVALGIEQDLRARAERVGADGEYGVLARLVLAQAARGCARAARQSGKAWSRSRWRPTRARG